MIDIRLDDDYEQVLHRLMEAHKERTATNMIRVLIRERAQAEGLWHEPMKAMENSNER